MLFRSLFDVQSSSGIGSLIASFLPVIVLLVVLLVLFSWIDSLRYSSWRGRYGTMAVPPVVYRPIFWWHRPGSRWYRRRHMPPPPPPREAPGVPDRPWAAVPDLLWAAERPPGPTGQLRPVPAAEALTVAEASEAAPWAAEASAVVEASAAPVAEEEAPVAAASAAGDDPK